MVNQDPDMALSVKLEATHANLNDFSNRNTVYQRGLSAAELGKGKKLLAKKKGKRRQSVKCS